MPVAPTTDRPAADRAHWPKDHPKVATGRIGVLLLNLGTPDGTGYWPMRRYLKEFLSDAPRDRGAALEMVADPQPHHLVRAALAEGQGLREDLEHGARRRAAQNDHARSGGASSRSALANPRIVVDWAMRYANPTTEERIRALQEQGCDRILLVPLYPQYAAATTATAADHAFRALMKMRWQPAVRVAPAYHDDPVYIGALARRDEARPCGARLRARAHHRDVSRHAAKVSGGRRSLSLPVPENFAPVARETWHGPGDNG